MLSLSGQVIIRRSFQLRVVAQQRGLTTAATTGTGISTKTRKILCAPATDAFTRHSRSRIIGISLRTLTSNVEETFPALEKLRRVLEEYRKAK